MEGRENKTGKGVANEYVIGARNGFLVKVDYKNLTRTCQHHQKEITFMLQAELDRKCTDDRNQRENNHRLRLVPVGIETVRTLATRHFHLQ